MSSNTLLKQTYQAVKCFGHKTTYCSLLSEFLNLFSVNDKYSYYLTLFQTRALSEIMDIYKGHLCKSAPRSAADFGWETEGMQSKFRGTLKVGLTDVPTLPKIAEITLSQKVESSCLSCNLYFLL